LCTVTGCKTSQYVACQADAEGRGTKRVLVSRILAKVRQHGVYDGARTQAPELPMLSLLDASAV
jgi:hypothetical protein